MPSTMDKFGFFLTRIFASTKAKQKTWPYVPGNYFVTDPTAQVAVTTLGSVELAEAVSKEPPPGLNIVGKVETENIGIEKIIKNILSNQAIRYLICAGNEPPKHLTGATMVALFENGIDEYNRVTGSPGMRPVLPNTTASEVWAFRQQVELVNMIGCTDVQAIHARVVRLAQTAGIKSVLGPEPPEKKVERVVATSVGPHQVKLDKAGYFVINIHGNRLLVEHYSYKDKLIRVIEGYDARSIYLTLIRNGWVSTLDHSAYLGKELVRAEWSIAHGLDFVQDGA